MIILRPITEENYPVCITLKVHSDQASFVSSNMKSLSKASIFRACAFPMGIYVDEVMVGFVLIRYNKAYDNYFIWQLMIDHHAQNKGYGRQAMAKIIDWIVKRNDAKNIVTTVIRGNDFVEAFYISFGFTLLGDYQNDENDYILKIENIKDADIKKKT